MPKMVSASPGPPKRFTALLKAIPFSYLSHLFRQKWCTEPWQKLHNWSSCFLALQKKGKAVFSKWNPALHCVQALGGSSSLFQPSPRSGWRTHSSWSQPGLCFATVPSWATLQSPLPKASSSPLHESPVPSLCWACAINSAWTTSVQSSRHSCLLPPSFWVPL